MDKGTTSRDYELQVLARDDEDRQFDNFNGSSSSSSSSSNGSTTIDLSKHKSEDLDIMKQAVHADTYKSDKYLSSGNITALVELDEDEREDQALIMQIKNVHKTYLLGVEGVPALRGVSLSVRRGEFLVVFGTSGGGKTSLLNIMGTIDKPTKGSLKICGTRVSRSTTDADLSHLRRNKLGFVFQTFNLLASLTALENVMLPMILAGKLTRQQRQNRARMLLQKVGMSGRLHHVPSQLSGGEQQRVTIARSIANDPEMLLLDEPTGDLDTVNSNIVLKLLTGLHKEQGLTLIMVTHELHLKNFADRVIWMRDGKIQNVEEVKPEKRVEAYRQLDEEYSKLSAKERGEEVGEGDGDEEDGHVLKRVEEEEAEKRRREDEVMRAKEGEGKIKFRTTSVRRPGDYVTAGAFV